MPVNKIETISLMARAKIVKVFLYDLYTLGQKPPFYPEITKNLIFEKCEFCVKRCFEIVNFVKNVALKM